MGVGYLIVEGHGELEAAKNLIIRLWRDLGLAEIPWGDPMRMQSLHRPQDLDRVCRLVRSRPDASAMLILRDEDDACPKEWLSRHFAMNKAYKPTLDQLPMTRMLDFDVLRRAGNVPCFFSLERALRFLAENHEQSVVYPATSREDFVS